MSKIQAELRGVLVEIAADFLEEKNGIFGFGLFDGRRIRKISQTLARNPIPISIELQFPSYISSSNS